MAYLRELAWFLQKAWEIRKSLKRTTFEPEPPLDHWICRLHDTVIAAPRNIQVIGCCPDKTHCIWWGPGGRVISAWYEPGLGLRMVS